MLIRLYFYQQCEDYDIKNKGYSQSITDTEIKTVTTAISIRYDATLKLCLTLGINPEL